MQEQIAAQMQAKKLPMVEDIRDESDHEHPTRIVIVPRSNRVDIEQLMAHLFATTDLERSYRVNLNIIGLDGRPKVMGLKELLEEWLEFRIDTVTRRLNWRLREGAARACTSSTACWSLPEPRRGHPHHPPRGRAEAGADEALQAHATMQAEAILETKLRHLAKLEEMKIRGEQKELAEERDELEKIAARARRG